jgi:hypothetical protein
VRALVLAALLGLSLPRAKCAQHASPRATLALRPTRDVIAVDAADTPLPAVAPDPTPASPQPSPAQTRSIIAGGGSLPSLNQVSLAQDVALARRALSGPSLVLFASGSGSLAQVEVDEPAPDPYAARIAALLDERSGRTARHTRAPVHAHLAATADNVLRSLSATLASSSDAVTLYVAAHGTGGENPVDSVVGLWEDSELTVPSLADVLDHDPRPERPVRVVITACFGGGFGELSFREADSARGAASTNRCGLFAAPFDRESAGCDPNPDRRAQAGFGLHFLHALRGEDRDGASVPRGSLDYDRDGAISLLDAHTRARIEGRSIDVPTTTSERWLRAQEPAPVTRDATRTDPLVIEEDAVIAALSSALSVPPTLAGARAALTAIDAQRSPVIAQLDQLDARDETLRRTLSAVVLARFPVLDDPWHRDFLAQLTASRAVLPTLLDAHPATLERANIAHARDEWSGRAEPLDVSAALSLRLWRAHETRALAARLRTRGGAAWQTFARLRACERSAP